MVSTQLDSAESRFTAALQLIKASKTTEAEALLRQLIEADPQHWRARQALAGVLNRARRQAEAVDVLSDGLMLAPLQRNLRLSLAQQWAQMGQISEALALMDDGARDAAKDPAYLVAHAQLFLRARRPDEAVPLFNAALTLTPADSVALLGAGLAHRALGNNDAALEALRRALASPGITPAQRDVAESRIREITGIGLPR